MAKKRHRATEPNQVWAWDYFHDRLADGRAVKWLVCIDKFTRKCMLLEPRRTQASAQRQRTGVHRERTEKFPQGLERRDAVN